MMNCQQIVCKWSWLDNESDFMDNWRRFDGKHEIWTYLVTLVIWLAKSVRRKFKEIVFISKVVSNTCSYTVAVSSSSSVVDTGYMCTLVSIARYQEPETLVSHFLDIRIQRRDTAKQLGEYPGSGPAGNNSGWGRDSGYSDIIQFRFLSDAGDMYSCRFWFLIIGND